MSKFLRALMASCFLVAALSPLVLHAEGLLQGYGAGPLGLAVSRDGRRFERLSDRRPFIPVGQVGEWDRFNNGNVQGEYYLTDLVEMASAAGLRVEALSLDDPFEASVPRRRETATPRDSFGTRNRSTRTGLILET